MKVSNDVILPQVRGLKDDRRRSFSVFQKRRRGDLSKIPLRSFEALSIGWSCNRRNR